MPLNTQTPCPCCSGLAAANCCLPIITGDRKAPTAEALMRSRYSAYTLADIDYLIRTWAPEQRQQLDKEEIRRWATESQWQRLEIHHTTAGKEGDGAGTVSFSAHYIKAGQHYRHDELSSFIKLDNQWYYLNSL